MLNNCPVQGDDKNDVFGCGNKKNFVSIRKMCIFASDFDASKTDC